MRTSQTFLRDATVVSPLALLLFGGKLDVMHGEGYVLVDDWIRIRAAAPTPGQDLGVQGGQLISTIITLLQDEEATRQRER